MIFLSEFSCLVSQTPESPIPSESSNPANVSAPKIDEKVKTSWEEKVDVRKEINGILVESFLREKSSRKASSNGGSKFS